MSDAYWFFVASCIVIAGLVKVDAFTGWLW